MISFIKGVLRQYFAKIFLGFGYPLNKFCLRVSNCKNSTVLRVSNWNKYFCPRVSLKLAYWLILAMFKYSRVSQRHANKNINSLGDSLKKYSKCIGDTPTNLSKGLRDTPTNFSKGLRTTLMKICKGYQRHGSELLDDIGDTPKNVINYRYCQRVLTTLWQIRSLCLQY